ncbi:MAG: hypothetical protein R3284_11730 [Rubricoccaceae bacterium]|nr:hypothetical protein [Rubricoccaceae bacterium]
MRNLVDVRGSIEPLEGIEVFGEWAGSTNDLNTLSDIGAGDDHGQAYVAGVRLNPLSVRFGNRDWGAVSALVRHRQQGSTFVGFDRTRPVEFNRTWNLGRFGSSFGADSLRELSTEGQVLWELSPRTRFSADAGQLDFGNGDFSAQRAGFGFNLDEPGVWNGLLPALSYRLDFTSSDDERTGQDGTFLRQRGSISRQNLVGSLTPGFAFDHELRELNATPDSVALGSFAFTALRPNLTWAAPKLTAASSLEFRQETEPLAGEMSDAATATTFEGDVAFLPSGSFSTEARVAYRTRRFTEEFREMGREDNESLAIRWTNRATPLNRSLEVNTVYEALTERTPLLQETYILVGSELGEYVWVDGGGEPRPGEPDGVPQVDEFFPETTPLEGTYARTFVPSDELFPTIGVQAQFRLRLNPGRLIRDRADRRLIARLLRSINTQTLIDVRERSTERDIKQIYLLNPAYLQQRDPRVTAEGDTLAPATINGRFRVVQDVTLFPVSPGTACGCHSITSQAPAASRQARRRDWSSRPGWTPRPAYLVRCDCG